MRIKSEPEEESGAFNGSSSNNNPEPESDMPTDLSMSSMSQSNHHHNNHHSTNVKVEQQQPQPLSLHDPPAKYRSHAYSLMKTNQEPPQDHQSEETSSDLRIKNCDETKKILYV